MPGLKVQRESVSKPALRRIYARTQELIRTEEFKDFRGTYKPPTMVEVRASLLDNPRWQARKPLPDWPGRNQLGQAPLQILGGDLIELDKQARTCRATGKGTN